MSNYNPLYQMNEREIDNMDQNNYDIRNNNYNIHQDSLMNEINKLKKVKERVALLEENGVKLNQLEQNVKNNEEKIDQVNKVMNDFVKAKNDEINHTKSFISQSMEYEKLQQENITLKADTLIYREDIAHLSEVNKKLENELELCRKKILDLINNNDSYEKELLNRNLQVNQLTEAITRLRLFDNPEVDFTIENRKNKDQKIQELAFQNKNLNDDNIKLVTENKILNEKLMNVIKEKEDLCKELNYCKQRENEQINLLEDKIQNLENQLNSISKENISLRLTDEKYLREIELIKKEKENFANKLTKKKDQLNQLSIKYNSLEEKCKQLEFEKQLNQNVVKDTVQKDNNKKEIFNDLYNKIQLFKSQVKNRRSMSPSKNSYDYSGN
jgi:chromosome segregation ATPase